MTKTSTYGTESPYPWLTLYTLVTIIDDKEPNHIKKEHVNEIKTDVPQRADRPDARESFRWRA